MNCRDVQKHIDDLLMAEAGKALRPEAARHIESCPPCTRQYEAAREALALIQPTCRIRATSNLKERIMNRVNSIEASVPEAKTIRYPAIPRWLPVLAVNALIWGFLITAATLYFGRPHATRPWLPAFSLLTRAYAAEETIFTSDGIVYIENEIVVKPVDDPTLASLRWIPIVSVESTGKLRFHQLALPTEPGKGLTVLDRAWYDSATGRFARLLTIGDEPIFANSYDGAVVCFLGAGADGNRAIQRTPVTEKFQPPKKPAEFLGITAGLPAKLPGDDESLYSNAGKVELEDGAKARLVKAGFGEGGPAGADSSYVLFTIREDDKTIARFEWFAEGRLLLTVRRVRTGTVEKPGIAWDLAGLENRIAKSSGPGVVGIRPDMVVPDVSLKQMVEKADFETYVFATDPPWGGARTIADVLDVASPPRRMFIIAYKAKDGRHVVFVQSPSYNKMLGLKIGNAEPIYTSPNGFKVYRTPVEKWMAGILLKSARSVIKDAPSQNRTAYVLKSPKGTIPVLAINGAVSDEELHALIDSLVSAREMLKE